MTNRQKQKRFSIGAVCFIAVCLAGALLFRIFDPITALRKSQPGGVYQAYSADQPAQMAVDSPSSAEARQQAQQASASRPQDAEAAETPAMHQAALLLENPPESPAQAVNRIYTTKRAVAFYFSGLGNSRELSGVLEALKQTGSVGQFFITPQELETCRDDIAAIVDAGMKLGISFTPGACASVQEQLAQWLEMADTLRDSYGYTEPLVLRQNTGGEDAVCMTAAAAGGFTVVRQRMEAVPVSAAYAADSDELIKLLFPNSIRNLQRGESVHFQMNLLQQSDELLSEFVRRMASEKSNYPVIPVADILSDTEELYQYPLNPEDILPEVRDAIYPGHLKDDSFDYLRDHYIGATWVKTPRYLPGFTPGEVHDLDKHGLVHGDGPYIYLTFDDWGTDASVEPVLQVLAKHNAKATFFIRTNNVPANPNLLRAIAKEGHAIGCHTDGHLPLSNSITPWEYGSLTDEQVKELQEDLVRSYGVLQSIVGDMTISTGPALTRLFRPPTLAMSRNGLFTVLDCGFTYSVSGSGNAEDFRENSARDLVRALKEDTQLDAVIILHMFENAPYDAEALDIYLTQLEEVGATYQFVPLSAALK